MQEQDREDLKKNDKKCYCKVCDNAIEGMNNKFLLLKGITKSSTMEHLEVVYLVITWFKDLNR